MVRLAVGVGAIALALAAGCGGRSRDERQGTSATGGSGAKAGAGGQGGSDDRGGAGEGAARSVGGAGAVSAGGTGGTTSSAVGGASAISGSAGRADCACDSTTPECVAQIETSCVFRNAHCPLTLDDALHDWTSLESLWGGYYYECGDGTRLFTFSYTFEGGFNLAFAADGSLSFASGGYDASATICGARPSIDDASCRRCQTQSPDESGLAMAGVGGAGGQAGAGGEAGVAGFGATTSDPGGTPYCLVDASGGLVMPSE